MIRTLDAETYYQDDPLPWIPGAKFVMFSLFDNDAKAQSYIREHKELCQPESRLQYFKDLIENQTSLLVGHNMSFDLHWLTHLGVEWQHLKIWDTKIAEYILRGQQKFGLELNDLRKYYNLPLKDEYIKQCWESGIQTDEIPLTRLVEYCEADAETTHTIALRQMQLASRAKLMPLIKLHMCLRKELSQAENTGMLYDVKLATEQRDLLLTEMAQDYKTLMGLIGREINLDSSDQVSCAVFGGTFTVEGTEWVVKTFKNHSKYIERHAKVPVTLPGLGFKPLRGMRPNDKGHYSTNAKLVLGALKPSNKRQEHFLEVFARYSKASTILRTYYDGLIDKTDEKGILHPRFHQITTATGRLSSSRPNGQNIPRSGTAPVKKLFRSRYV